jgi:hypothetical protein
MIPKTETAFKSEGNRDRLKDLLLTHRTAASRRNPEALKATTFLALDTGKELLKLKETLTVRDFSECIKQMGIAKSTADYYLKIYKKFGAYREAVSVLGASKLYCLIGLKEENIKNLVGGGTVSGFTLTDIVEMPFRKVRNIFRKMSEHPRPMTRHKRITLFVKHMKLAFSALTGGLK